MKLFIGIVLAAGLGTVAATIAIGSRVKEEQVVDRPYETGLGYDADRAARAALGWTARVDEVNPSAVRFTLWDGAGAPLDGAEVTVAATRPETSRDRVSARAQALGGGAYAAELAFAGAGEWVLQLDVRRGKDHLALERSVKVAEASTASGSDACDVARAPCTLGLESGLTLTLDLSPRPPKPFTNLEVAVTVTDGADRPISNAEVTAAFEMPGMFMGENRVALASAGSGRYTGRAVLVRCASGRRDWRATVSVRRPGMAPQSVPFDFRVTE